MFANTEDRRSYSYYRTRYGFSTGLDYEIKPGTSAYAKGLFSDFHDYGETWVYTPNAGNLVAVNGSKFTFDNAGSYQYRHYVRRPDQQAYSFLTGARHDLSSTLITYEFAGSRSHNIGGQDFATTNFNGNQSVTLALDQSNPFKPNFTALDGTNLYDPTQYVVTNTSFTKYSATQLNFQGAASVARRYSAHSHLGTFELGIKMRNSHSTQNQNDQILNYNGNSITLSSVLGTYTNPTYYDGAFRIGSIDYGPTSSYTKITNAVLGNPSQFSLDKAKSIRRSASAFYDANERIYAGYVQNVISFGKLRLQTGLRFDAADTGFVANRILTSDPLDPTVTPDNPKITPFFQGSGYTNVLPSVQAQYQIEKNTNIRGNFSMGISRPNIGDLVPSTIVDPNTSPKTETQGNPNLKPTKANNCDILVEHYFQPLGIIRRRGKNRSPALARNAPNNWNLGFTYDKARFSMRFGVSHNDANIAFYNYSHTDAATDRDPILGLKGPTGDVYFYAHTQYDIQGSYRLYKGLRFEASGLNLSNEVFGFYQGSGIYPVQREFYKPTVSLGLRWTSGVE